MGGYEVNWSVQRSQIHGVGVFANRSFSKGSLISTMVIQSVGLRHHFKELPSTGVMDEGGRIYVPLAGYPLWFTNYSEHPNVGATTKGEIIALRNITIGDELTVSQVHSTSKPEAQNSTK